jgi:hypothetical protein
VRGHLTGEELMGGAAATMRSRAASTSSIVELDSLFKGRLRRTAYGFFGCWRGVTSGHWTIETMAQAT